MTSRENDLFHPKTTEKNKPTNFLQKFKFLVEIINLLHNSMYLKHDIRCW